MPVGVVVVHAPYREPGCALPLRRFSPQQDRGSAR